MLDPTLLLNSPTVDTRRAPISHSLSPHDRSFLEHLIIVVIPTDDMFQRLATLRHTSEERGRREMGFSFCIVNVLRMPVEREVIEANEKFLTLITGRNTDLIETGIVAERILPRGEHPYQCKIRE